MGLLEDLAFLIEETNDKIYLYYGNLIEEGNLNLELLYFTDMYSDTQEIDNIISKYTNNYSIKDEEDYNEDVINNKHVINFSLNDENLIEIAAIENKRDRKQSLEDLFEEKLNKLEKIHPDLNLEILPASNEILIG